MNEQKPSNDLDLYTVMFLIFTVLLLAVVIL